VLQELQLKHQAVDAFREMAAVIEEQLRLDNHEQKKAASSDLQKYMLSFYISVSTTQQMLIDNDGKIVDAIPCLVKGHMFMKGHVMLSHIFSNMTFSRLLHKYMHNKKA